MGFEIEDGVLIKYEGNENIIHIPTMVTSIGDEAFSECRSLASITIPDSVTSIDVWAFQGCKSLKSITIPSRFKGKEKELKIPSSCIVTYY